MAAPQLVARCPAPRGRFWDRCGWSFENRSGVSARVGWGEARTPTIRGGQGCVGFAFDKAQYVGTVFSGSAWVTGDSQGTAHRWRPCLVHEVRMSPYQTFIAPGP